MKNMEIVKISDIKPASYNPRLISSEAFEELQGSLKTLGFILPIIVNKDNMTIVAGHQRTKAATKVGITEVPAYFVKDISLTNEIAFNQVHNGIESEPKTLGTFKGKLDAGFHEDIPNSLFEIPEHLTSFTKDICLLINNFGDALCAIVCGNEVLFGNNYIKACQCLDVPVHVSVLPPEKKELFCYYFSQDYGVFNYEHIKREDFVQGLAQMTNKTIEHSRIYQIALPFIKGEDRKDLKILDFGCGKAFSISYIRKELNYKNAIGIEFFNHNRKGIAVEKGQEMITNLINFVQKKGKFDYVICDSVLNSVNSQEAENAVLESLMLFCKTGGKIFFCGRTKDSVDFIEKQKKNTADRGYSARFLDENGLTAKLRNGQWYYQKFHTKEDVDKIIKKLNLEVVARKEVPGMWYIGGVKTKELTDEEYLHGIDFEFNMTLPNNQRYGRHNDVRKLFGYPEKC